MSKVIVKTNKNLIIGLVIVLIYASIISFLVHTHEWDFQSSKHSLTWIQPENSTTQPLISPDNSKVEFAELEKSLARIPFNNRGNIQLNIITANILKTAVSRIPLDASPEELSRIQFLIEKIHPQQENSKLVDIIFKYREYEIVASKQAYRKDRAQGVEDAERSFKADIQLKENIFGKEVSDGLFTSKHAMAFFVLESMRILKNPNLTNIEKENLLSASSKKIKLK